MIPNKALKSFRYITLASSVLAGCLLVNLPQAAAQTHIKYCQGIESTAEAMACVNDHKATAQNSLNAVFQELRLYIEKRYLVEETQTESDTQAITSAHCERRPPWEESLLSHKVRDFHRKLLAFVHGVIIVPSVLYKLILDLH